MTTGAIYLTNDSPGAPTLNGVNGSLCAVLDWALAAKSWAIEYTATNERVYRPPSGNRFRLFVSHNSAISGDARLATVRGCENATAATPAGLVDPFPTVAQVANVSSTIGVSATPSSVARGYRIVVSDRFLLLATDPYGAGTSMWDLFLFGDVAATESADTYATICHVGNNSASIPTDSRGMGGALASGMAAAKTFWCRSIDATVKSSRGCLSGSTTGSVAAFCTVAGAPAMRGGYLGRVNREKVAATCIGSSGTTTGAPAILRRGWVPNLWNPLHSNIGGVTSADEFTDSAYAVGSKFVIAPASAAVACIIETTDTWSAPVG